jgi:hypothetical protein
VRIYRRLALNLLIGNMLNAEQQEQIIKANKEAFETLALRWRKPETGETEPDLRKAVLKMVCDYFSVPGCGSDRLYHLISDLQDAAFEGDNRPPVELMEGEIESEVRARLKQLYTDPDPGRWYWDDGEWDWELSLRDAQEDVDCGYVAVVPLKDGHRFEHKLKPPFSHHEWAIKFVVGFHCPPIHVRGSLQQAKRCLDMLIGFTTPEIKERRIDE